MEDDPGIRNLAVNALTYCVNREIISFQDGLAAWNYLDDGGPADIVVTDVDMPRMDGLELLTRIKGSRPEIIVVIMSGKEENQERASLAGADAFLSKPFAITDLFDLVQTYVVDE